MRSRAISAHLRTDVRARCHCRDCQRQTGSEFVLDALIETDRTNLLSGALEPVAVPTDSGRPHEIIVAGLSGPRSGALWLSSGAPLRPRWHARRAREAARTSTSTRIELPWIELRKTSPRRDLIRHQGVMAQAN